MKWLANLLLICGAILLIITALGLAPCLSQSRFAPPRSWEVYDETLAAEIQSVTALEQAANLKDTMTTQQKAEALYNIVTRRFTHSRAASHTLFSNWILYGLGLVHPVFSDIYDPETMLRQGRSLVCSQSSYLLLHLARRAGLTARHVGLKGHVVTEIFWDDAWHMFDPDFEVVARNGVGKIAAVRDLEQNEALLRRYYTDEKSAAIPLFTSIENNSFVSYPQGAYFEWKSTLLSYFERFAQWLKWLVPLVMIALGMALRAKGNAGR